VKHRYGRREVLTIRGREAIVQELVPPAHRMDYVDPIYRVTLVDDDAGASLRVRESEITQPGGATL